MSFFVWRVVVLELKDLINVSHILPLPWKSSHYCCWLLTHFLATAFQKVRWFVAFSVRKEPILMEVGVKHSAIVRVTLLSSLLLKWLYLHFFDLPMKHIFFKLLGLMPIKMPFYGTFYFQNYLGMSAIPYIFFGGSHWIYLRIFPFVL